MLDRIMVTTEC